MEAFELRLWDGRIGRWLNVDPLAEKFPDQSPYDFCFNNPLKFVDPDGKAPTNHWQLNSQGKLVMTLKTNDKFNVFYDEKGNKLFQTNQMSTEMTTKTWEGKGDEYINKLKTAFIDIADQPQVYNTMVERAKETGFDSKIVTLAQMKEVGETYKANGPAIGALEMAKQMPKFATGNILAGAGPNGFLQQLGMSIYTGTTGTDIKQDYKSIFSQAQENLKTFVTDFNKALNDGISKLSKGSFSN